MQTHLVAAPANTVGAAPVVELALDDGLSPNKPPCTGYGVPDELLLDACGGEHELDQGGACEEGVGEVDLPLLVVVGEQEAVGVVVGRLVRDWPSQ